MKTAQEYIESIKKKKFNVYMFGEKIEDPTEHPMLRPSLNAVAMTYELANQKEYESLMTVTSHLTGEKVNRFTHTHRSTEDLVNKVKMQRLLGQKTGTCFQRCVGMDATNALSIVTYEMDEKLNTQYNKRFLKFLEKIQKEDLVCDGAMTDPKGDRGKRPIEQEDPDLYLRVVEKWEEGIVVRGAKCHQTGAVNSHMILVMPTMAMGENETDYAVSFATDSDTPGITYIVGRQPSDTRKMEAGSMDVGNAGFGGQECLVIFDDVFVPWEQVFMCGEWQYSGKLVELFAGYHRQSYGGCKVGVGDVLIGATASIAELNGVEKKSHVKDKIVEMIHLNETLHTCGLACSYEGQPTPSGTYLMDMLYANVTKLNVTRFPYDIARLAEDICGGLIATMPSEADLRHPELGKYITKYLKGISGVETECRLRLLRLVENLTLGAGAAAYRTESMHGAGPPQAQRVVIARQANLDEKKKIAKDLAGIEEN